MAGNDSMAEFCAIPDLTVYVVDNNATDLSLLQNTICSGMINFTLIQQELVDMLPSFEVCVKQQQQLNRIIALFLEKSVYNANANTIALSQAQQSISDILYSFS